MVLPLTNPDRPAGRPVTLRLLNGPVPPLTVMLLLKPGRLTVQVEDDSAPSVGAALMVTLNVPVAVAPVASLTVTDALPKVPTEVGVPVKTTQTPAMEAVMPDGRLAWATTVN